MPTTSTFSRLPYLDGLRGLTCVAVVLHHCVFHGARIDFANPILNVVANIMNLGYTGVEVFFVLSGFCIAAPMFLDGYQFQLKPYLIARLRRLYPAYFLTFTMLAVIGIALSLGPSSAFSSVFPRPSVSDIGAGLVLYRVWGNTVFWTLVIEARWYLLLPLAVLGMIAIEKRGVNKWIGSATLLLMSGILSLAYLKGINATPGIVRKLAYSIGLVMAYLPILVSGVVLARHREFIQLTYHRHHVGISIVLLLVGIGCMTQFPADPTNFTMAKRLLFAGGGALAIFILAMISPIAQRFLEHPLIIHLGKISYTAYLIHLPLIQVFKHIIPSTSMPQPLSFVTYYMFLPIILMTISHCAWHLLEAPFLRKPVRTVTEPQA